jgi:hypothetical protein
MIMYCVKCKQKTESNNIIQTVSMNNRRMIKGICSICGSKKSSFVKNDSTGSGIGDILINGIGKYVGELHLPADKGEFVPNGSFNNLQKYSYCGPGTKYDQRVKEGYNGINELDSMCKLHDKFYNENNDTQSRNISDIALAHRANEIANDPRFDNEQRRAAKLIALIMNSKARFGLGVNSKNSKKGPVKRK